MTQTKVLNMSTFRPLVINILRKKVADDHLFLYKILPFFFSPLSFVSLCPSCIVSVCCQSTVSRTKESARTSGENVGLCFAGKLISSSVWRHTKQKIRKMSMCENPAFYTPLQTVGDCKLNVDLRKQSISEEPWSVDAETKLHVFSCRGGCESSRGAGMNPRRPPRSHSAASC